MSRNDLQHALDRFGEQRGFGALPLDADSCVTITHDNGIDVLCTYLPAAIENLVFYAELGVPADREQAFRHALEANHLWSGGDNVTLGLLPGSDEMTACMMLPIDDGFADDFSGAFDHFAKRALYWARLFGEADESSDRPQDTDTAAGGSHFLRV